MTRKWRWVERCLAEPPAGVVDRSEIDARCTLDKGHDGWHQSQLISRRLEWPAGHKARPGQDT